MTLRGLTFSTGWATDRGCVREVNEDACFVAPHLGVWAVADGMGGHQHGQLASAAVVAELQRLGTASSAMELRDRSEAALISANAQMRAIAAANGGGVVGSTVAMLLVFDTFYACIWCGDSRVYLTRHGAISPITRDHTEIAELLARGVISAEEAAHWPRRNVITRALGVSPAPELEMTSGPLEAGDVFVLCSDGLTTHVGADEIRATVSTTPPQAACDQLVATTIARGATDNVTVVVARNEGLETAAPHLASSRPDIWDDPDGE